jgi:small subunit ribosomal protein S17
MPAIKTAEKKPIHSENKVLRQTFSGVVSSDKMKDTAVVLVKRYIKHQKYHKFMNKSTKIMAHDPGNTKKIGDKATIEACRPISKNKAFRVIA